MATPIRGIRVDADTWQAWERAAHERGTTVSRLIRDAVNATLGGSAIALASDLQAEPADTASRPSRKPRTAMCEHRNPAGTYCTRCDS